MSDRPHLNDDALDALFRSARTHRAWQNEPVGDDLLQAIYDLAKLGPTSGNCCPLRILFVRSDEAKARLLPTLAEGNREKSKYAAAVALFAWDVRFYEKLPKLSPQMNPSFFAENPEYAEETAFRNSSLQAAYFMIAARALGVDCGPMSGFNAEALNKEFFPDGLWKINFVCNLGVGDGRKLSPRAPRLDFEEACRIA